MAKKVTVGKKVRLVPTKEQEKQLWRSAGTKRFIYNWTLARQKENYANGGKFIRDNELRKEITKLKKGELSWLYEVSNNIPKQAVKDACNSYKNFFNGKAKFPRFKSKKRSKPSFYNDNCKLKVKSDRVLLEKVGWVKLSEKDRIPVGVKYFRPTVSYDNKYWYISVSFEKEVKQESLTDKSIGIDLGIENLAICSDKRVFKNINKTKEMRRLNKKLKRLQRQVSRKYEMLKKGKTFEKGERIKKTKNIIKLERIIKLVHRRIANIRLNHVHQITNSIVKTKPYRVVMEDLNIQGMMKNKYLAKSIAEQCLYKFIDCMRYKCEWNGIEFIQVDRFYPSSKICSNCGIIKKDLKLRDRLYKCDCGFVCDRDLNASINLANYE